MSDFFKQILTDFGVFICVAWTLSCLALILMWFPWRLFQ